MVDLPLIDEDTGVFGNVVAIQRCVFCRAEKEEVFIHCAFTGLYHPHLCSWDSYVFVLCSYAVLCENLHIINTSDRD